MSGRPQMPVAKPIRAQQADVTPEALARIVAKTRGYPYFLQECGKHVWDIAQRSPITARDVVRRNTRGGRRPRRGVFFVTGSTR